MARKKEIGRGEQKEKITKSRDIERKYNGGKSIENFRKIFRSRIAVFLDFTSEERTPMRRFSEPRFDQFKHSDLRGRGYNGWDIEMEARGKQCVYGVSWRKKKTKGKSKKL